MNQNGGIHKGGFAVLCHRNGGSESPGILMTEYGYKKVGFILDRGYFSKDNIWSYVKI